MWFRVEKIKKSEKVERVMRPEEEFNHIKEERIKKKREQFFLGVLREMIRKNRQKKKN